MSHRVTWAIPAPAFGSGKKINQRHARLVLVDSRPAGPYGSRAVSLAGDAGADKGPPRACPPSRRELITGETPEQRPGHPARPARGGPRPTGGPGIPAKEGLREPQSPGEPDLRPECAPRRPPSVSASRQNGGGPARRARSRDQPRGWEGRRRGRTASRCAQYRARGAGAQPRPPHAVQSPLGPATHRIQSSLGRPGRRPIPARRPRADTRGARREDGARPGPRRRQHTGAASYPVIIIFLLR